MADWDSHPIASDLGIAPGTGQTPQFAFRAKFDFDIQLGLEVWDGTVDGESRLAIVGENARTQIICRPGRPWLPTGRLAEAHPVEVTVSGASDGTVLLGDGGRVTVRAS